MKSSLTRTLIEDTFQTDFLVKWIAGNTIRGFGGELKRVKVGIHDQTKQEAPMANIKIYNCAAQ